jgi:hypothetical protein
MVLNQITIEDVLERYIALPDELLTVLEDPNTEKIVEVICQKNNISKPEWIDIIKQLVGYVLMGFIHYYDLGAEINTELNFPNSKLGNDVASEIDAKIFSPIKNLLEKNYSPILPQKQEGVNIIKEPEIKEGLLKKELQPEPKPQIPQKQGPVPLEKITIPGKVSTLISEPLPIPPKKQEPGIAKTAPEKKSPLSFMPFVPMPEKIIPQPPQKETAQIFTKPQITPQNIPTKQTKEEPISPPNKSQIPPPVFIHKEETVSPIRKGVEIKPQEIKISSAKSIPTPPKPVQIEIGSQNKTENKDLGIKVVNYSESAINQPETPNISKKEEPQNNLKIPPLSSQSSQAQKPLPPTPPPSPNSFSQIPSKQTPPKPQIVSDIPPLPSKPNIPPPPPKP